MAVTFNPSDKSSRITLSGGNLVSTFSSTPSWELVRCTNAHDAADTGGFYCEFLVGSVTMANAMFGVSQATDGLSYNGTYARHHHNINTSYGTGSTGTGTAWGAIGDRLGLLLRSGKLFLRKNGTWMNSGNPAADTGYLYSGLTGRFFPSFVHYSPSGTVATFCGVASDIVGSIPSGARAWGITLTLSTTLVDETGSPIASTAVTWAVFKESSAGSLATIDRTGSGTTDASGVLTISYDATEITSGSVCGVLISTTTGTADANCRSSFIARTPTVV